MVIHSSLKSLLGGLERGSRNETPTETLIYLLARAHLCLGNHNLSSSAVRWKDNLSSWALCLSDVCREGLQPHHWPVSARGELMAAGGNGSADAGCSHLRRAGICHTCKGRLRDLRAKGAAWVQIGRRDWCV